MEINPNTFCIIMAGGSGSRFWPMSRNDKPKQFLDILGTGYSLIRQTYLRVSRFCLPENIYIVTGSIYKKQVLEHIPEICETQVLSEPFRRNTAPCIAYATQRIALRNPNALVVVAPSDHLIINEVAFLQTIRQGLEFAASNNALITIGIKPSRPETGYGYIQVGKRVDKSGSDLFLVKTFTEKPNVGLAQTFLKSGEFFWNSGLFIWSLASIQEAFNKHLPDTQALFDEIKGQYETENEASAISDVYSQCKNISIDYGVMEKADNVFVICSEFGWSDLGTWGSLAQISPKDKQGNAIVGNHVISHGVKNSIIRMPKDKLVLLQGLEGYIVVESDNMLLVCKLEEEQNIKNYVDEIIAEKGPQFA